MGLLAMNVKLEVSPGPSLACQSWLHTLAQVELSECFEANENAHLPEAEGFSKLSMYVFGIASMWFSRHVTALSGDLDGTARFVQMCRIANVLGRGETRGAARVSAVQMTLSHLFGKASDTKRSLRYLGGGSSQGHCQLARLRNASSLNQSGHLRAQVYHTTGRFVN
jgi:hypothetical protein